MLTSPSPFRSSSVRNPTQNGHVLGRENVIDGFPGDPLLLQSKLLGAQTRLEGLFRDGHRFLIAKDGVATDTSSYTTQTVSVIGITVCPALFLSSTGGSRRTFYCSNFGLMRFSNEKTSSASVP
jgi:hypothetical protein